MISMSCKTKQQPIEPKRMKKTSEHVSANAKVHACQTDDECSFTIEIKSLKGTHINREYPHRFMPMLKDVLLLGSEMTYKNDNEGMLTLKYKRTLNTPFENAGLGLRFRFDSGLALGESEENQRFSSR